MAAGETLLKITDFPFVYSLVAIIFSALNLDISGDKILIFVGISGSFGTFLTITDPLGRAIKYRLKIELQKIKKEHPAVSEEATYAIQAIPTRSISLEVDKLASVAYFVTILLVFNYFISYDDSFASKDKLVDSTGKLLCDTNCIKNLGNIISFGAAVIIAIVGTRNWKELRKHVLTAGIHQQAISTEYTTQPTKDSMSKAIEQNDWPTAEEWANIIKNEIKLKKGKKDAIAQVAETVYESLYMEALQIKTTCDSITQSKSYQGFSIERWRVIKSGKGYLMVDDDEFRSQLDGFYDMIGEYQVYLNTSNRSAKRILQDRCTESYGKINEIYFRIETIQGTYSADVVNLITYGSNPADFIQENLKPKVTQVEIRKVDGTTTVLDSANGMDQFNEIFQLMLEDASKDEEIRKLRTTFEKINSSVIELRKQLTEKIKAQW